MPLDTPAETTAVDPCAVPTITPPVTTTTTPPPTTTTTTTPVVPAECVSTPAVPEPVTPTPASETVPEPAAPPVTAAPQAEPAAPVENTLEPLPAKMIPAAPATDQPITPDAPELSSKTAEPDLDWAPTENPNATLVPGQMRSDREEIPAPFTKEDADKAEMGEARLRSSRSLMASGCQYYWPSPFQVCDDIRDKYNSLGGPASFLSYPTSGNIVNPDGTGQRVTFLNGPIYWHPSTGAHPVVNSFLNRWGIHSYEAGWLGYPITDEIVHADAVGRRQEFQHGAIYVAFVNAIGSTIPNGPIRDKWNTVGAETPGSLLGYPIQDQIPLPDGQGQMDRFERGVIYWHPIFGARPVTGPTLNYWASTGYEQGPIGYPIDDEYTDASGLPVQDFQNTYLEIETITGGDPEGPDPRYTWYYPGDTWVSSNSVGHRTGGRPSEAVGGIHRFNWSFQLSDGMQYKGRFGLNTRMGCQTESYREGNKQAWYNDTSHGNIEIWYHLHGSVPNNVDGDEYWVSGWCAFSNNFSRPRGDGTIRMGTTLVDFEFPYIFLTRSEN